MDRKAFLSKNRVKLAFKMFDKNNDGTITAQEFKDILGSIF